MLEIFIEIIEKIPYGLYILVSICILWKIAEFYFVKFRKIEETTDSFEKEIKPRIDKTNTNLKELKTEISIFRNPLSEIQKFLEDQFDFAPLHPIKPKGIAEAYSPIRLTDFGYKLLKESGAEKVIDDQYEKLEKIIDEKHCKTALDVQWFIQKLVPELRNKDFMNPVKNFVYNNPKYNDIELEFGDVERAMVLYLRNKYLKKHPELI